MSFDLKMYKECDHRVIRELLLLELDRKTIRIPYPLGSPNVYVSVNSFSVPSNTTSSVNIILPYSGWSLMEDEKSVSPKLSKIVFDREFSTLSDHIEISYTSQRSYCRKCFGIGSVFDYNFYEDGRLVTIDNLDKLRQDALKTTLTDQGSNPFHSWIGTNLNKLVGQKFLNKSFIASQIRSTVATALANLRNSQLPQSDYQIVTDEEMLSRLVSVDVEQDDADPTLFELTVVIQSKSGSLIEILQALQLAGTLTSR